MATVKAKEKRSNKYCSVPQCKSRFVPKQISLHTFPNQTTLRKEWIRALKIGKTVSKYMYVCSLHFDDEDYFLTGFETSKRYLKKNAVPSKKLPVGSHDKIPSSIKVERRNKRALRAEARSNLVGVNALASINCECLNSDSEATQDQKTMDTNEMDAACALLELQKKVTVAKEEEGPLMVDKSIQFDENTFKTSNYKSVLELMRNNKDLCTMTGLPNFSLLDGLVQCIKKIEPIGRFSSPLKERVVLTMMRLKLDVSFRCLSVLFQCSATTCQNYFHDIVKKLAHVLKQIIRWPEKDEILHNMPVCFNAYKKTRVVLDCTEVATEKTRCLKCRILTYSHYKGRNTVKFLIGVAPSGLITFVSRTYGGRASDKAIFNQSDLLEKLVPHDDAVMIDKGFLIENECFENAIEVIRPPFKKKKKQFSKEEADRTASIASARVHVERAIQRVKLYKVLSNTVTSSLVPYMDEIALIICAVVNLTSPILALDEF